MQGIQLMEAVRQELDARACCDIASSASTGQLIVHILLQPADESAGVQLAQISTAEADAQAVRSIQNMEALLRELDASIEHKMEESCVYSFMQDTLQPEPGLGLAC